MAPNQKECEHLRIEALRSPGYTCLDCGAWVGVDGRPYEEVIKEQEEQEELRRLYGD